jgi:hypothetical protein
MAGTSYSFPHHVVRAVRLRKGTDDAGVARSRSLLNRKLARRGMLARVQSKRSSARPKSAAPPLRNMWRNLPRKRALRSPSSLVQHGAPISRELSMGYCAKGHFPAISKMA